MRRKIIFLDIDGTLTEPGSNTPPASALQAIARARENGHFVFLCSGRSYGMLRSFLQYDFDGVAASAGGYIECGKRIIYDCPMTEDQRRTAMEVFEKNGVFRTLECRDDAYTDEKMMDFLREREEKGLNKGLSRWREQVNRDLNIRPMKEYRGQPVYKIGLMSPSRERFSEPQKVLASDFVFCMEEETRDGLINGEIINRKFNKGEAVRRVCEYLGILVSDSVAVGDSMNDLEMIRTAGLGICMENGSRSLKEMADDICPPVGRDGIYQAFLKHHII